MLLHHTEQYLRYSLIEHLILFVGDRIVYEQKGNEKSIVSTDKDLAIMAALAKSNETILLHNHPMIGYPPSCLDYGLLYYIPVSEFRVINTEGVYRLKRPKTGWLSHIECTDIWNSWTIDKSDSVDIYTQNEIVKRMGYQSAEDFYSRWL